MPEDTLRDTVIGRSNVERQNRFQRPGVVCDAVWLQLGEDRDANNLYARPEKLLGDSLIPLLVRSDD